jgi:transcriptional regulator with XRE-family HTH domain
MVSVEHVRHALAALGARLRAARLGRNEPMAVFAERIGVSVPTLRDMERGSATVQIGFWLNALWALDRIDEVSALLAERESLIDRAKRARSPARRRASRAPRRA